MNRLAGQLSHRPQSDLIPTPHPLVWHQSKLGGGGFITGLRIDPFNSMHLYARCDVAGSFRSTNGGATWQPINAGMSEQHHHQVQGLIPSPHTQGELVRLSGDAHDGQTYGSVHLSHDAGDTWTLIDDALDFYGNGPTRSYGDVASFDPFRPHNCVISTWSRGVWILDTESASLEQVLPSPGRFTVVAHHPKAPGLLYAGTCADRGLWSSYMPHLDLNDQIREYGDTPRGSIAELWRSLDHGRSWSRVAHLDGCGFTGLAFGDGPEELMISTTHGMYRSSDGGRTLDPCITGLPPSATHDTVARDPHRSSRYLTSIHLSDEFALPIWYTDDFGDNWDLLHPNEDPVGMSHYPDYMDEPARIGQAISKIVFHPHQKDCFYTTGYWGVSVTFDCGKSFSGQGFRGIETTCMECVITDPNNPSRIAISLCDHPPAISMDSGALLRPTHREELPSGGIAFLDDGSLIYGAGTRRRHRPGAELRHSNVNGSEPITLHRFPGIAFIGSIARRPGSARVFILVDGDDVQHGSPGLYRSEDNGQHLEKLDLPFEAEQLPLDSAFVDKELLPCVVYQERNSSGANNMVVCDPHLPDVVLLGEWSTGVWRSDNAGETWKRADMGLPFGRRRTAVLMGLYADESRVGRYYACFAGEGLWRSDDFGASWAPLFPTAGIDHGLAVSSVAVRGDLVAAAVEPMWWTGNTNAVLITSDGGKSWTNIHDPKLGALRYRRLAFGSGSRLHAVTVGNGAYYTDLDGLIE